MIDFGTLRDGTADPKDRGVPVPEAMFADERIWAGVPLIHAGRLAGLALLARPPGRRALDWEDFDLLRTAGWRGQGPIPWRHGPNRGFLLALYALRRAAESIGETDEVARLTGFLEQADPAAIPEIERYHEDALPPTAAIVILGAD